MERYNQLTRLRKWFGTYNYLECHLPKADTTFEKLSRRAFIGFAASIISDCISNSLRVLKTYRQVNETKTSYMAAARAVIAVDGITGLFGRGLKTRILANGLQGLLFSVLWKFFMDLYVFQILVSNLFDHQPTFILVCVDGTRRRISN